MPMATLYKGKFIWVCDLVTDEKHRFYMDKMEYNQVSLCFSKKGLNIWLSNYFYHLSPLLM